MNTRMLVCVLSVCMFMLWCVSNSPVRGDVVPTVSPFPLPRLDEYFRGIKQKNVVVGILQNMIYPKSAQIIASGNIPSGWSPNVTGRINPVGYFDNAALTLEYFYGLAGPLLGSPRAFQRFVSGFNVKSLQSEGNIVSYDCDFTMSMFGSDGVNPIPGADIQVTHFGYFAFDRHDQVCGYEAIFRNLGLQFKTPPQFIPSICGGIQVLCTGSNQQYDNTSDCISFMTSSIPLGTWNEADQNNVVCRSMHSLLVPMNPVVHCPHTGKTGGGKCVDKTAASYYQYDYGQCKDTHKGFHFEDFGFASLPSSVDVSTNAASLHMPSQSVSSGSSSSTTVIIALSISIPVTLLIIGGIVYILVVLKNNNKNITPTPTQTTI